MIEYTLKRSKRKTVAIYVRDGSVEVRAPLRMVKYDIDRFVMSKEKWITDKLVISNERSAQRESFILDYNSSLTYRGKQYPIEAREGERAGFDGERFYMPPKLMPEQIKETGIKIYRLLAKNYLIGRTSEYALRMSVVPAAVKITGARTRWGSCSGKKSINYSWRLIMADDDVIDYIIVHELAHLTELNHSERFWKIVENTLPDYIIRQARLKELHSKLATEDWD